MPADISCLGDDESVIHEEDSLLEPNDDAAQIGTLARALALRRGFGLYFVCVNQANHRRLVLEDLRARLPAFTSHDVFVRDPTDSPLRYLQDAVPNLPFSADARPRPLICVYGMENWLGGVEGVETSEFVASLNVTRTAFADALGCPLLFCVPEHILVGIMRGAPDFFSVRSGVYFLDTPPEDRVLPSAKNMQTAEIRSALGMGIEQRKHLASEWEEILNGYRALPLDRRDPLAEARALDNLAVIRFAEGEYSLAIPLMQSAAVAYENVYGPNHQVTASSINNLASAYASAGDFENAIPLQERVTAIYCETLGPAHIHTNVSINNLASLWHSAGDSKKALTLHKRALAAIEQSSGVDNIETAASLNNLGLLYQSIGEFSRALPLFERSLVINERVLGPLHPDTASSLSNLASIYQGIGNATRALPLLERALAISERALGAQHPNTASSLNNIAVLYEYVGDYMSALSFYERALSIQENVLGADHPDTKIVKENIKELRSRIQFGRAPLRRPATARNTWDGSLFAAGGRPISARGKQKKKR